MDLMQVMEFFFYNLSRCLLPYFLDFESDCGCDEDVEEMFKRNGGLGSNFATTNLLYFHYKRCRCFKEERLVKNY